MTIESLEARQLLTATFDEGVLQISELQNVVLASDEFGHVTLNGNDEFLPGNQTVNASEVHSIYVTGTSGNDIIDLSAVLASAFDLTFVSLSGGAGSDTITGSYTADIILGGTEDDVLHGGAGDDSLWGGAGNDWLYGDAGNDSLAGESGNDTYAFSGDAPLGTDTITEVVSFTSTNDRLDFSGLQLGTGIEVNLLQTAEQAVAGDDLHLIFNNTTVLVEEVKGTDYGDRITGSIANNVLIGGKGDDTYVFIRPNDAPYGIGDDSLVEETSGADGGSDTVDFSQINLNTGISLNLGASGPQQYALGWQMRLTLAPNTIENVIGTPYNDYITGTSSNNLFIGGGGNDTLTGGDGNDVYVFAGDASSIGTDTINDSAGRDKLDFSLLTGGGVLVDLVSGNVTGGSLSLATGFGSNIEDVLGTNQADTIYGNSADNIIQGGGGSDTLYSSAGTDTLAGGADDDWYVIGTGFAGTTTLSESSGQGIDTIDFSPHTATVQFNLGLTSSQANNGSTVVLSNGLTFENVIGGSGDDTIYGNDADNELRGGDGADYLSALGGNDWLYGEGGDWDQLIGGEGHDNLVASIGNDRLLGDYTGSSSGNDTYWFAPIEDNFGVDYLYGELTEGGGLDTLNFSQFDTGVTIDLSRSDLQAVNSQLTIQLWIGTYENVIGGSGSDTIYGNSADNIIQGGGGNDTLYSSSGTDTLAGGTGDDWYVIQSGITGTTLHELAPDGDRDKIDFSQLTMGVAFNLSSTAAQLGSTLTLTSGTTFEDVIGSDLNDLIIGNSLDNWLEGGGGADEIYGGSGDDKLWGGLGGDRLDGELGNDWLYGEEDSDNLIGGSGDDNIEGGAGGDSLRGDEVSGGTGNDVFWFKPLPEGVGGDYLLGGNGIDTLDFSQFTSGVTVDLSESYQVVSSEFTFGALEGVENVVGGSGNDILTGNTSDNLLQGNGGNDTYRFTSTSSAGADMVSDTDGVDALDFSELTTASISANLGNGTVTVSNGSMTVSGFGQSIERVVGTDLDDTIYGNSSANTLEGRGGSDWLYGYGGNDTLIGGAGSDVLIGGADDDTYKFSGNSPLGVDVIDESVGGGNDTVDFSGFTTDLTIQPGTLEVAESPGLLTLQQTYADGLENFVGGSGTNTLVIQGTSGADTFTVTATGISRNGGPTFAYAGFNSVLVNGLGDSDSLLLNIAGAQWTINGSIFSRAGSPAITVQSVENATIASAGHTTLVAQAPGTAGSSLQTIAVNGAATTNIFTVSDTSGTDDSIEVSGNTISVNGGSVFTLNGIKLAINSAGGKDTIRIPSWTGTSTVTIDSGVDFDNVDLSWNTNLSGIAISSMVGVESLNLSHTGLTSLSSLTFPSTLVTLDLRYNNLNLATSNTLSKVAPLSVLRDLYLYGNPSTSSGVAAAPDLQSLKGKLMRVDLAPVGLEEAERQLDLDDALTGIAKALHYLPLAIFDYVRNNYEFQAYRGAMKGIQAVIQTGAGNDLELAQLLNALLSKAGLSGTIKTVQAADNGTTVTSGIVITEQQAKDWLGVRTVTAAAYLLNSAGYKVYVLPSNMLALDHTWLSVTMGGTAWTLDPSWKFKTFASSDRHFLDKHNAGSGPDGTSIGDIVRQELDLDFLNPLTNPYYAEPGKQVAFEWFEDRVAEYLSAEEAGLTLGDLKYDGPIQTVFSTRDVAPPTPGTVSGSTIVNPTIATENWRVRIKLEYKVGSTWQSPVYQAELPIPDYALTPIALTWSGTTAKISRLRLDGGVSTLYSPTAAPSGATKYRIQIGFTKPGYTGEDSGDPGDDDVAYERDIRTNMVIGLEANQLNDQFLTLLQKWTIEDSLAVDWNSPSTFDNDQTRMANILALSINRFFQRTDQAQDVLDGLLHTVQSYSYVSAGVASSDSTVPQFRPDLQLPYLPTNLFVDVPQGRMDSVSIERTATSSADAVEQFWFNLMGASSSAQESGVWEELANNDAMSTVKSLQLANSTTGNSVITITPSTWNTPAIQNALSLRPNEYASIEALMEHPDPAKRPTKIIAPTHSTDLHGWEGIGYLAIYEQGGQVVRTGWIIVGANGSGAGGYATTTGYVPPAIPDSRPYQPIFGDPVNAANGAVYEDATDIHIPAPGIPLVFERHYDSRPDTRPEADRLILGDNWYATYFDKLSFNQSNPTEITWLNSKGHKLKFTRTSTSNPLFKNPESFFGEMRQVGSEFWFTDVNGLRYIFYGNSGANAGRLHYITDQHANLITIAHDASGRVTSASTNGMSLTFVYTSNRLDRITTSTGIPANDRTWEYKVTGSRLTEVEGPHDATNNTTGRVTQYTYNTSSDAPAPIANLLKEIKTIRRDYTQPSGSQDTVTSTITHTYYANGRAFQTFDSYGNVQTYHYNLYRNQTTFTDERGNSTEYHFDNEGRQLRMVREDRATEKSIWYTTSTNLGLLQFHTDVYGLKMQYIYDTASRLSGNPSIVRLGKYFDDSDNFTSVSFKDRNEAGNINNQAPTTNYTYETQRDANSVLIYSKVKTVTRPSVIVGARVTTYTYDTLTGDLVELQETVGYVDSNLVYRTSYWDYDSQGQLVQFTDGRGDASMTSYTTTYSDYNQFGQAETVTKWIDANTTATEHYDYDSRGYLISYTDANGHETVYAVDILGRRTQITQPSPDGTAPAPVTVNVYDHAGNLVKTTDAEGRETEFTYDANNRVTRIENADGSIVSVVYDPVGNVLARADGRGSVTQYQYDDRNRLWQTILPDGSRVVTRHDGAGNIYAETDALGRTTLHQFDIGGREKRRQEADPDGSGPLMARVWLYQYDLANNLIHEYMAITPNEHIVYAETNYFYDFLNRLVKRIDPNPTTGEGENDSPVQQFTYDAANNLLTSEVSQLNNPSIQQTTGYAYDGLNRRTQRTAADNGVTQYEYDAVGNLRFVTDPRLHETEYVYDNLNRLVKEIGPPVNDGTPESTYTRQVVYEYDQVGNLETQRVGKVGSAAGDRTVQYVYDSMNRRVEEKHFDFGGTTAILALSLFAYDEAGNRIKTTDPRGNVTRFEYDRRNRLVRAVNALGAAGSIVYDAVGNVIQEIDAAGKVTTNEYDGLNRLTRVVLPDPDGNGSLPDPDGGGPLPDPDGNGALQSPVKRFVYDSFGDLVKTYLGYRDDSPSHTNEFQRETVYSYDRLHRMKTSKLPTIPDNSETVSYTYDVFGNQLTENSSDQSVADVVYTYDDMNRLETLTETDPEDSTLTRRWTYTYDQNGNLVTEELSFGSPLVLLTHTEYVYDSLNRRTQEKFFHVTGGTLQGLANSTLCTYDVMGNKLSYTDEAGRKMEHVYDALGRETEVRHLAPGGAVLSKTAFAYDAGGNLIASTQVFDGILSGTADQNRTTVFGYDRLDRLVSVTDPLNHTSHTAYDSRSNVTSTTDALGNRARYVYDALGRRTFVIDPRGGVTGTEYDEAGSVTKVTDPEGHWTSYQYDPRGNLFVESRSGVAGQTYTYFNSRGQRTFHTDLDGLFTSWQYDAFGRLAETLWAGGGYSDGISYAYAADDQLTQVKAQNYAGNGYTSQYDYAYDSLRRLGTTTYSLGGATTTFTNSYHTGNDLTSTQINDGAGTYELAYAYDGLGRLLSVGQSGAGVASLSAQFSYNAAGELAKVQRSGGGSSDYAYDRAGRLVSLAHSGPQSSDQGYYDWLLDAADRIALQFYARPGAALPEVAGYLYDAADQLTSAEHSGNPDQADEGYSYDSNGNRLTSTGQATSGAQNRLTTYGDFSYSYDNQGRLKRRTPTGTISAASPVVNYVHDTRGRLVEVNSFASLADANANQNAVQTVKYVYDGFDRRIVKIVDADGVGVQAATTESFVYGQGVGAGGGQGSDELLFSRTGTTGAVTHRYLHGVLADQVLADEKLISDAGGAAGVRWLLSDHQGSVRRLINSSGGNVADISYDSFGNVTSATTPGAVDLVFGYTGQQYDEETGLSHYKFRYYDPYTGKFLREDPEREGSNFYVYVRNNAVNFTDPWGLSATQPLSSSYGAIGGGLATSAGSFIQSTRQSPQASALLQSVIPSSSAFAPPVAFAAPVVAPPTPDPRVLAPLIQGWNQIQQDREAYHNAPMTTFDRNLTQGLVSLPSNTANAAGKYANELGAVISDLANYSYQSLTGNQLYPQPVSQTFRTGDPLRVPTVAEAWETTRQVGTLGLANITDNTYRYAKGEISGDEFRQQVGVPALMQLATAPLIPQPGAGRGTTGNLVSIVDQKLANATSNLVTPSGGVLQRGATLYRVAGGEAPVGGRFYTTVHPETVSDFRAAAGLFEGNTADTLIEAKLMNLRGVRVGTAAPGPATPPGALRVPEVFVPNPASQIRIIRVSPREGG